jgi:hypothetical protein
MWLVASKLEVHCSTLSVQYPSRRSPSALAPRFTENGKVGARINTESGADFLRRECLGEAGFEVYYIVLYYLRIWGKHKVDEEPESAGQPNR